MPPFQPSPLKQPWLKLTPGGSSAWELQRSNSTKADLHRKCFVRSVFIDVY